MTSAGHEDDRPLEALRLVDGQDVHGVEVGRLLALEVLVGVPGVVQQVVVQRPGSTACRGRWPPRKTRSPSLSTQPDRGG